MSPTTYILAIPLGLIAISGWLVKMENDSFVNSRRTADIQQVATLMAPHKRTQSAVHETLRLDHERYGDSDQRSAGSNPLGEIIHRRPIGGRATQQPWLDYQSAASTGQVSNLPDIPGVYIRQPQSTAIELPFQSVSAESGFHITADEATKLDLKSERVVFRGNVTLSSPQFHLTSDQVLVHLGQDRSSFKLVEATGRVNVQLTGVPDEKKYRGQSQTALYDPKEGKLTLSGWPKVQGKGQELVAAAANTKIYLFTDTGRMLTEGAAQTRLSQQFMSAEANREPQQ